MPVSFADIKAALPFLNATQKRELSAHLKALNADAPADKREAGEEADVDWLLSGIAWEASHRAKIARPDPRLLLRLDSMKAYRAKCEDAKALILRGFPGEPPGPRALATMGRVAGRCLFEHLKYIKGQPVAAVLANVNKVGEAIDACFPGYIAMGVLHVIVAGAPTFLGRGD